VANEPWVIFVLFTNAEGNLKFAGIVSSRR
jgi:hypothetical protein